MSDNIRTALYHADYEPTIANKAGRAAHRDRDAVRQALRKRRRRGGGHAAAARPTWATSCAVFGTGAYCYTMASNYNGQPRPAIVFVKDGQRPRDHPPRNLCRPASPRCVAARESVASGMLSARPYRTGISLINSGLGRRRPARGMKAVPARGITALSRLGLERNGARVCAAACLRTSLRRKPCARMFKRHYAAVERCEGWSTRVLRVQSRDMADSARGAGSDSLVHARTYADDII